MMIRLLFFCILFTNATFAQQWMSWNECSIGYQPIKKINIQIGGQYRWNGSEQQYNKTLFSARLEYKLKRMIQCQIRYRRAWMPNDYFYLDQVPQTYGHRIAAGVEWDILKTLPKKEGGRKIGVQVTSLWQLEHFKFKRAQEYWRNKMQINYEFARKKWKTFFSLEHFYRFNQTYRFVDEQIDYQGLLNEWRYEWGIRYAIKKNQAFSMGILYRDFQTLREDQIVLQLSYHLDIAGDHLLPFRKKEETTTPK